MRYEILFASLCIFLTNSAMSDASVDDDQMDPVIELIRHVDKGRWSVVKWTTIKNTELSRAYISGALTLYEKLLSDLLRHEQLYRKSPYFDLYLLRFFASTLFIYKELSQPNLPVELESFPTDRLESIVAGLSTYIDRIPVEMGLKEGAYVFFIPEDIG